MKSCNDRSPLSSASQSRSDKQISENSRGLHATFPIPHRWVSNRSLCKNRWRKPRDTQFAANLRNKCCFHTMMPEEHHQQQQTGVCLLFWKIWTTCKVLLLFSVEVARKFVEELLQEGGKVACDETNEGFNGNFGKLPEYYDEEKYNRWGFSF